MNLISALKRSRPHRSQRLQHVRNLTAAILCTYFAVTIPLRIAFLPDFDLGNDRYVGYVVMDAIATSFFLWEAIDILFRSSVEARVVPIERGGSGADGNTTDGRGVNDDIVAKSSSTKRCKLHFRALLSVPFLLAVMSSLPLEYLALLIPSSPSRSVAPNYLMLNRTLMLLNLPRHLSNAFALLEQAAILKNIGVLRAWKLFFAMALAGHWCGCGFFLVAKGQALGGNPYTWPEDLGIYRVTDVQGTVEMVVNTQEAYIQSLYWAYITMITTGFGDIVPLSIAETVWCIFCMYVGVVISTLAIANLQLLVTSMDAALANFQRKTERIKMYMKYRKLPSTLASRIVSFYDYQWNLLKGADEEQFLEELPRSLQQQVANFMCRDLVASIPFLRKANNALLNALAECAEFNLSIYSPNDDIIKPGERIKGAFLVFRGEVEVLRGKGGGTVERKLQRFDRFAEESLFVGKVCDRYVRAKTFCEVYLLPADEFQHIIKFQCDESHIAYMKATALSLAKSSVKANKMFGSAEDAVTLRGFKRHCLPTSNFRKVWACLQLVGIFYYFWTLPLSMMKFLRQTTFADSAVILSLGYVVDIFFIVNLVLTSSCFVYLEQGLVVFDGERIRQEFFRTHNVAIEVVAALPVDVLLAVPALASYHHILRMTKLLRLHKIFRYTDSVERVLADLKLGANQSMARVFKLNYVMIVVCHWVACLWYACADYGIRAGATNNWRDADEADEARSIDHDHLGGSAYLRSIYWAIVGMSTVGYGDIVPTNPYETTFAALVILFGGLLLPAVVGGLAAYLGNLNVALKVHRNKLSRVRSYMRNACIEQALVQRVLRFYDYLWCRQGGVDEEAVMDELPGPIRQRVAMHVNGAIINSVPFFSLCDDTTKELLLSVLKPKVFLPTDIIAHQGEVGTEMYLIERGQVVVSSQDDVIPYCTLGKGDYFGESCLLGATVRVAKVTSLTYCDCFVLSKDDYNDVMSTCDAATSRNIDNAIADAVHRKTRQNTNINRNISDFPKCRRQAVSETLAEVTETAPGLTARFLPESAVRRMWDIVILFCYSYNAISIPFRIAFLTHPLYYIVDWAFDLCLVVDSLLNFREFAVVIKGDLVTKRGAIKRHYVKTRLKTDMVSSLPLDLLTFLIVGGHSPKAALIMAFLRLPKLLRLRRLPTVFGDIYRTLEDTNLPMAPIRLTQFFLGVILVAHWAACGFFTLARWGHDRSDCVGLDEESIEIFDWASEYTECLWRDTWIQQQIMNGKLPSTHGGGDVWQLYIRAFNWALPTLVVVVIGDVTPVTSAETLYVFLWIVVGVSINATIIGSVANIVANLETESTEFVERLDAIKSFVHRNNLGPALQARVEQFMAYLWATHGGVTNDDDFIHSLPYTLQLDLTKARQRHIRHCPFFDFCSDEIIRALTLCLKLRVFSPNDVIIHADDMGQEMYFLERGTAEVISRDGKTVFATLLSGCFFGETALFFKQQRNSTIRAAAFCEVYQLDKSDLDRELRQRDFDLSRMLGIFTDIAKSNKRRNEAVADNLKASTVEGTKLYKLIKTDDATPARGKRATRKAFLPNSAFRVIWDLASLVFAAYYAVSIPYWLAFVQEDTSDRSHARLALDFSIDIFFIVDMYLRGRCFAVLQHGTLVTDELSILRNYFMGGMVFDIISCLPLEVLAIGLGLRHVRMLRVAHFLRVLRLPQYLTLADSYLTRWGVRVSASSFLLTKMFFFYAMTNHWLACGWMIIHRYLERSVKFTWATTDCANGGGPAAGDGCLATWDDNLEQHNVCNSETMTTCYTRAVYYVITTISTVGYGDISPVTALETIYQNIVVLTGACFFAGIIGAFSAWLSQGDTSGSNSFKLKLQRLREYMACREYPSDLQGEIVTYHNHRWDQSHVLDKKKILSTLPLPLQMDLSYGVMRNVLGRIPFIGNYPLVVQKRIAHALTVQVCPPDSPIYTVGDIGWDVYFIAKGTAKISLPKDNSVLDAAGRANAARLKRKEDAIGAMYRPGNHFGESCLTSESGVRQETVTSNSAVELYLITKDDLEAIWKYMPVEKCDAFKNDLLSRNGNAWHSFEGDDEGEDEKSSTPMSPLASPSSYLLKQASSRRLLTTKTTPIQRNRSSIGGGGRSRRLSRRRADATASLVDARLGSFSAATMTAILESRAPVSLRPRMHDEEDIIDDDEEDEELEERRAFGVDLDRVLALGAGRRKG